MKHMGHILAVALAIFMAFAIATPALAANDDGSITILNTVPEQTYTAYKVFDATYSEISDAVAYSYDGSNATFLAALNEDEDSPFTATLNTQGTYNIAIKDDMTKEDVSTFLKKYEDNLGTAISLFTGDGEAQTKNDLAYGYYYITTTTGTAVSIDSAIKNATVIDKNETIPGPTKTEKGPKDTDYKTETTANIGDIIDYKVTGTFTRYVGETRVDNLTFIDTMSEGLTPMGNVVVKINDTELTPVEDYSFTVDGQTTTITIPTEDFRYKTGSSYEVTYRALVNENAVVASADKNTVTLYYNSNNEVGSDTTTVTTYGINLIKIDEENNPLEGAKFKLYDAETGGDVIMVVLEETLPNGTNVYRHAMESEIDEEVAVEEMEVGKGSGEGKGVLVVEGLANGTYYFDETDAPDGYNKLIAREAATIYDGNGSVEVVNETGVVLPSTGGIGTTLFYVIGGVMVLTAGIVLVTKRRMNSIED